MIFTRLVPSPSLPPVLTTYHNQYKTGGGKVLKVLLTPIKPFPYMYSDTSYQAFPTCIFGTQASLISSSWLLIALSSSPSVVTSIYHKWCKPRDKQGLQGGYISSLYSYSSLCSCNDSGCKFTDGTRFAKSQYKTCIWCTEIITVLWQNNPSASLQWWDLVGPKLMCQ